MDWLNYHHLRYFWTVAREGSLRAAAEKLSVSQPSISAQLNLLEAALGRDLFRRAGRGLALTETGQVVLAYADDIFRSGQEMLEAVRSGAGGGPRFFHVGVVDSLPKMVVRQMLSSVLTMAEPPRLICREGLLSEVLPELAAHRLDLVLADEPSQSSSYRLFNHSLGFCGITFCAAPKLARRLRRSFPASLDDAPAILPSEGTPLRRAVELWFDAHGLHPHIVAECDDAALMKMFAREELGFVPIHAVAAADVCTTFRLSEVGTASDCRCHLHAITAERRLTHPAILTVTQHAQAAVFGHSDSIVLEAKTQRKKAGTPQS